MSEAAQHSSLPRESLALSNRRFGEAGQLHPLYTPPPPLPRFFGNPQSAKRKVSMELYPQSYTTWKRIRESPSILFVDPSLGDPAAQHLLAVPSLGGDGPVTRRSPNALQRVMQSVQLLLFTA